MKKKTNNEETIKEKILSRLLEGPKTQTQLLTDLEYETNQHGNISKSLKTLRSQGFIVEKLVKSEKLDDYCKLWSIVPNSQNFKNMLKEFSGLLPKMHKSEMVRDTFIIRITYPWLDTSSGTSEVIKKFLEGDEKKYITEKMRLSLEYFKYIFNNSNDNSQDHNVELAEFIEELDGNTAKEKSESYNQLWEENSKNKPPEKGTYYLETVFKICVFMDILNGHSSEEAKEYLKKMGSPSVVD